MSNYTTNLAVNPGMQLDTTGYSSVLNSSVSADSTAKLAGNDSLLVQTSGNTSGEGVITPSATAVSSASHSFSLYVMGDSNGGTISVSAIINPGGTVAGTVPVTLTPSWQRVIISGISVTSGDTLNLMAVTSSSQTDNFWIANVQVEPSALAHPYCDGGQPGCSWTSSAGGTSFQAYQNSAGSVAGNLNTSETVSVLVTGEVFTAIPLSASNHNSSYPVVQSTVPGPVAAMTDFAIFELTDPDPAQTYTSWNTASANTGTGSYVRNWGIFIPPQDYPVSDGSLLYKRAAYMAVGWQFTGVANTENVSLSDIQAEILPVTTGYSVPSPTAYDLPRSIHTIIKPDRLNFCPNPSIEISTSGWTATGTASVTRDTTKTAGNILVIDDDQKTAGTASLKVTVNANLDGTQITIPDLIAGDTYIVSAYVQADIDVNNIEMFCASGSASVLSTGVSGTGYGSGGYGTGFYGGVLPPSGGAPLATGQWFRIFTTFTPTDSSAVLSFEATGATGVTYPTHFWVDAVLVEAGQVLDHYFDGSFGTNYFWETGGTPGVTRSYYYDQYAVKARAVTNVLAKHTPLGISYSPPLFKVPYTQ